MLDEEKRQIFPHISDSYLMIDEDITLNIVVDNLFSCFLFEKSSYYRKLNDFMTLLSSVMDKKYKIEYVYKE
jgi:hypothetical protein